MMSPFWIGAAERELKWEEAVIDRLSIQEAVDQMDEASAAVLRAFYNCFGAGPVSEERLFFIAAEILGCRVPLRIDPAAKCGNCFSASSRLG